jgi:hypothetical protein
VLYHGDTKGTVPLGEPSTVIPVPVYAEESQVAS